MTGTTGQQQHTVQQSTECAAIKSTRARHCVSPGPLCDLPGSSVDDGVGPTCRLFSVGTRLLLRVHARGICLPVRIRPSSPTRSTYSGIALLASSICLIMDQVRPYNAALCPMYCLNALLPCLTSRHSLSLHSLLTNTNTRLPAKSIDPFTAGREDGVRYRAASVRLGPQASAYNVL